MFKTNVGPIDDGSSYACLRPETAQQIFTNFKNVVDSTSETIPFSVHKLVKHLEMKSHLEILYFVCVDEQMELEYFVTPGTDEEWHKKWVDTRIKWWIDQGIDASKIKRLNVTDDDLAHIPKSTVDQVYEFPHGIEELGKLQIGLILILAHIVNQDQLNINATTITNKSSKFKTCCSGYF